MEPKVSRRIYNKRFFDPTKADDLELALCYIRTGRWTGDGCPFVHDWPYTNVPDMIKTELLLHYLPKIIAEKNSDKKIKVSKSNL